MPHPNQDFINRFGYTNPTNYTDPEILRYLSDKKNTIKKYNELKNKDTTKLNESVLNKVNTLFEKGIKKPLFENKTNSSNKNWEPVSTPFGIFYYNKQTNEWMNSYGVIRKNEESFFNPLTNPFVNPAMSTLIEPFMVSSIGDTVLRQELPAYNSVLPLLRFVDADIYGYMIEKNADIQSIDEYYPQYPYTVDQGLTNFGSLFEFYNLAQNINSWDNATAGKAFLGGALGNRLDVNGATSYGGLPGSTANIWSQNWARLPKTQALSSFYDIGDVGRRGGDSYPIYPSTLHKYQWFDFRDNIVKGSLKISIAAGYGGSVQIDPNQKLNVPRTGYTTTPGAASPIYDLLLSRPTVSQLEAQNPHLVTTNENGVKIAKIRELFSDDLNGDGTPVIPEPVRFVSIDASVDQTLVTLDERGSIRILYNYDISSEAFISASLPEHWNWLAYFDKEWIANGFLTDDTGQPVFIENKDFVSVTVSGGLGSFIYVWCLHKSGKLYGVEIVSAAEQVAGPGINPVNKPKEKFIVPGNASSGRNPEFGKAPFSAEISFLTLRPDEYQIYYNYSSGTPISSVDNGLCKEIAHVLNFIPKVNNYRFPVISVWGGYHTGGILVCVDPRYIGYLPSIYKNEFPVQMCEIIKLQKIRTFSSKTERLLSKIQRYKAVYNSGSQTWSYIANPDLDLDMYNNIFGITENINGTNQIIYVPPRCVSIQRNGFDVANASPTASADGIVNILSNNGTFTVITGNGIYVPCYFDETFNPNYSSEMNTYNKLTMKGDFSIPGSSWDYNRFGTSGLFNHYATQANPGTRYKFEKGNCYTNPSLVLPAISLENYNEENHWKSFWDQAETSAGWGNPPPGVTGYYGIIAEGSNTDNIFGFSYFDYFGNANIEGRASFLWKEGNYINNSHIQKVVCYGDTAGNLPIYANKTINNNFDFKANTIAVLKLADNEVLENPFAWIRGVGDLTYGIKCDGTIDLLSFRTSDVDGFIFDPFWGGVYPTDRTHPGFDVPFYDLKPANYLEKIESMKKLGSFIQGSYTYYNYSLPDIYNRQN